MARIFEYFVVCGIGPEIRTLDGNKGFHGAGVLYLPSLLDQYPPPNHSLYPPPPPQLSTVSTTTNNTSTTRFRPFCFCFELNFGAKLFLRNWIYYSLGTSWNFESNVGATIAVCSTSWSGVLLIGLWCQWCFNFSEELSDRFNRCV